METQIMSDNSFVVDESFNPKTVIETEAQAVPIKEVKHTHEFRPDVEGKPVVVKANENDQEADAECEAIEPTAAIVPSTTPVVESVSTTRVPRMHCRCVGVLCVVRKPRRGCIRGVTVSRRTYYVPYCT